MTAPRLAAVCLLGAEGPHADFPDRLEAVLEHTPAGAFELRLGFAAAPEGLHHALGRLCAEGAAPRLAVLPGGVERWGWEGPGGLPVRAWSAPGRLPWEALARLLFHEAPLETEYAVWLSDAPVGAGWWQGLAPLMERRVDCVGGPGWLAFLPGQAEAVQARPWYRGAPFPLRQGRPGVAFPAGPVVAVRSACLREAGFPPAAPWAARSSWSKTRAGARTGPARRSAGPAVAPLSRRGRPTLCRKAAGEARQTAKTGIGAHRGLG